MSKMYAYSRTMAGARQLFPDEPIKRRPEITIVDISREFEAARRPRLVHTPLPPVPEAERIPKTTAQKIIAEVAQAHGLTVADILGKSRSRKVIEARFDAVAAVKTARPMMSLNQLGRLFRRDHTSAHAALRKRGLA